MGKTLIDCENLQKYFAKGELVPAVVQDAENGEVLMLAYMNRESLKKTLETGFPCSCTQALKPFLCPPHSR